MTKTDVSLSLENHVALVEIKRPPHNFFDETLIGDLAQAFEDMDRDENCRALVLASEGKSFCAGANFSSAQNDTANNTPPRLENVEPLYAHAARLFACKKPVVAAVQGAAVGGGLGVALVADFRVVSAETRFAANFVKLGIHPGFGLTYTLPRLIGEQKALKLFMTGRRIGGEEAFAIGLADLLVDKDDIRQEALKLAGEIAINAPLAVQSTRATLRGALKELDIVASVKRYTAHEAAEQNRLFGTSDHKEGVASVSQRRAGNFTGR